jgi:hypothetical protein
VNEYLGATLSGGDEAETAIIVPFCESAVYPHLRELTRLYKNPTLQPQGKQDVQIFIDWLVNWVHSVIVPYFWCLKQVIRL